VSLSNLGTELGRATSSDGGLTFVYTNASGNTASLDIQGDGSIEVQETPPLPGGSSTHSTTCTGTGATLECTATVVNSWSTPTTVATTSTTAATTTSTTAVTTTAPTVLPTTVVQSTTTSPTVLPTTVVQTTTTTTGGTLPATGSDTDTLLASAGALIVLGAAALLWSKSPEAR